MEALYDWFLQDHHYLRKVLQEDEFEVSDILLFKKSLQAKTKKISNAELVQWLDGVASSGDYDGILGITRIVWIVQHPGTSSTMLSKDNMRYVMNHFGVRPANGLFIRAFTFWRGNSSPTKKQSFGLDYNRLIIDWTYDYTTNRTEAIFCGDDFWRYMMLNAIQSQQRLGLHPLFIGSIVLLAKLWDLMDKLDHIDLELRSVESRTRHNVIVGGQAAAGSYAFLSAKMSGQAQAVALCEDQHTFLLQNLDWLSQFQWPQDVEKPSWLATVSEEVDECSHFVRNSLKCLEPYQRLLSKRVDIQLTALFNLISQEENRLSRFVAQDSRTLASATKDDSTAMKTLAAVTVVFLPGTFVAALFSMPLFQWDTRTKPHSAISEQFWIYWATTLPLTILTLASWFAWMRLQTRRHRARDKKDKEELDLEVDDRSRESFGSSYSSLASNEGSKTSLRSHGVGKSLPDALDREVDDISLRSLESRHSLPASIERSTASLRSPGAGNSVPDALDHEGDNITLRTLASRHSPPASIARSVTSLRSHGSESAVPDTGPETEKGSKQA